jgi:hypothetical protein
MGFLLLGASYSKKGKCKILGLLSQRAFSGIPWFFQDHLYLPDLGVMDELDSAGERNRAPTWECQGEGGVVDPGWQTIQGPRNSGRLVGRQTPVWLLPGKPANKWSRSADSWSRGGERTWAGLGRSARIWIECNLALSPREACLWSLGLGHYAWVPIVILVAQVSWPSFSGVVHLRNEMMFFWAPFPGDRIICWSRPYVLSLDLL